MVEGEDNGINEYNGYESLNDHRIRKSSSIAGSVTPAATSSQYSSWHSPEVYARANRGGGGRAGSSAQGISRPHAPAYFKSPQSA